MSGHSHMETYEDNRKLISQLYEDGMANGNIEETNKLLESEPV